MTLFAELSAIIVIAAAMAFVMRLVRQPLIVGYIATGVLVGPYALDLLHAHEEMELFSKIGISTLLFIVGLTLNPDIIREVGKSSVVTGIGQVVFTSVIGFFLLRLMGFDTVASVYVALALTFSSTIIILKLLTDRGDTGKLYGKLSIGFLLIQDLVATMILLVVAIIGGMNLATDASPLQYALLAAQQFGVLFVKGLAIAVALYFVSKYILPRFSQMVAHNQEVLFMFAIAWGLGLASLFQTIGFSIEIGALIAGAMLAVSPFAYEIGARMKPLRDFFIVIFFILLGAHMVLAQLTAIFVPALVLSAFVLVGNPLIVILLTNLMGYRTKTAFMSGLTVAQISEFSLILVALGHTLGHISQEVVSLVTLVGIITITVSTYFFLYAERIFAIVAPVLERVLPRTHHVATAPGGDAHYEALLFGYDYAGHGFVQAMRHVTDNYLVVEYDPEIVSRLQTAGIPCRYGDAEDVEFLNEIGYDKAKLVISSIPYLTTNLLLVKHYRAHNPDGIIIVVANEYDDVQELYRAGASYVVMPYHIGAHVVADLVAQYGCDVQAFHKERQKHLAHLASPEHAALWSRRGDGREGDKCV